MMKARMLACTLLLLAPGAWAMEGDPLPEEIGHWDELSLAMLRHREWPFAAVVEMAKQRPGALRAIRNLRGVKQPYRNQGNNDAYRHSELVTAAAASYQYRSWEAWRCAQLRAATHDVGKALCTFIEHDADGNEVVRAFGHGPRGASLAKEDLAEIGVEQEMSDEVAEGVFWHMLPHQLGKREGARAPTADEYRELDGSFRYGLTMADLHLMGITDRRGCVPPDRDPTEPWPADTLFVQIERFAQGARDAGVYEPPE